MQQAGATLHRGARASSLSRPLLLRSTGSRCAGSVVVAHGPSCSAGMWDLPRPGFEPVSLALAGRFSTTAPPGKPSSCIFTTCESYDSSLKVKFRKSMPKAFHYSEEISIYLDLKHTHIHTHTPSVSYSHSQIQSYYVY